MSAYYNEIDPCAAQWLRNLISAGLIAPGDVDERSIVDVRPDDLRGYTQCHFFAGIGGWSLALRLAGWPDNRNAWTGSCPCQRESSDGYHTPSGEVIPMTDKRIKDSPDGEFHWCAHQAGIDAGKTICLFVPPRSY